MTNGNVSLIHVRYTKKGQVFPLTSKQISYQSYKYGSNGIHTVIAAIKILFLNSLIMHSNANLIALQTVILEKTLLNCLIHLC